ncbi:unnamed protein product, partial [Prorocentrum cordatum]
PLWLKYTAAQGRRARRRSATRVPSLVRRRSMDISAVAPSIICLAVVSQVFGACGFITRCARDEVSPRRCADMLSAVSPSWISALISGPKTSVQERALQEHIFKVRENNRLRSFRAMQPLALVYALLMLFNDFFVNDRWQLIADIWSNESPDVTVSRDSALWASIIFRTIVGIVGFWFQQNANLTFVRGWHMFLFLRLVWECVFISDESYPYWLAISATERVGLSAGLREPINALVFNVVISISCFVWHPSAPFNQHVEIHLNIIGLSLLIPAMFDAIGYDNQRTVLETQALREEQHRATVEAQALRTAEGLLSSLCDAVVHLDEDLRIKGPSPRLAGLLLRQSSHALAGVPFADMSASPAEAKRLLGFLRRDREGSGSLHTSLRDSNASAVKVQLYHMRGLDVDDRAFHVVGVCEEAGSFREPPAASAAAAAPLCQPRGASSNQVRARSSAGSPSGSSLSSSARESVMTLYLNEEVTLYFRPFVERYPIEHCSVGCAGVGLPTPGESLIDFFEGNSDDFVEAVQQLVMAWHKGHAPGPYCMGRLRFTAPRLRQARIELRAQAELSMQHNAGIEDLGAWTVKACLSDVQKVLCLAPRRGPRRPPQDVRTAAAPRGRQPAAELRGEGAPPPSPAAGRPGAARAPFVAGPLLRRRPTAEVRREG